MRELDVVAKTRDTLFEECQEVHERRKKLLATKESFSDLSEEAKELVTYLGRVANKLMTQVTTLTFVLNEDSKLEDPFEMRGFETFNRFTEASDNYNENLASVLGQKVVKISRE